MKQGWKYDTIGELLLVERGGSPRPIQKYLTHDPDGLNWIKISDATASDKYIYETKQKIKPEGLHKTRLVKDGDFLLSNSMSFGKPYIMKTTGCIHDGWLVLREKHANLLDKDFLYHLLCSPYIFDQFDTLAAGSTVRNLNIRLVSSVVIPVPPLPEQKRIVAKLDQAFEAIDKAKANVERNLQNAKDLFQSELNRIFSQKGEGWVEKKLGECIKLKSGDGLTAKNMNQEGLYPVYGGNGIAGNHDTYNSEGMQVIIGRVGALCGNVRYLNEKLWLTDNAFKVSKFYYAFDEAFLTYLLNYKNLRSYARQAAQPVISNSSTSDVPLEFPLDVEQQKSIVSQLDELKTRTQYFDGLYNQKLDALSELKKSILQKAFIGEL